MILVIGTKNKDKAKEIKDILSDINMEIKTLDEFDNILDITEDAPTIEGNSVKKATAVARITNSYCLSDDTGLEVEYLNGKPGVLSARWAGEKASYEENNRKLLEELKNVSFENRKARFKTAVTLASPEGKYITETGVIEGYILEEPRGKNGFGYDPLFWIIDYQMTLAELPPEIKNKISHRKKAIERIKPYIIRLEKGYEIFY